ncbi:DUF6157 family protein [Saccharibacillus sp. CPCC 101409]|uniref:DUF6157 family protein n=1 Tax=Saccharibacillus sp. CPCC 101409 TaxID=3058041 RepID=UPI0026740113|nr:DUF6157 family protein [Saccharibacillus sp. CPCC 101409]MDO3409727.1 DUF6157 family protein [Saccharibacillus sp. CPCC 101409]
MKTHNYYDTFIAVAEDCPAAQAEVPKAKGASKSIAVLQYEMIADHPYRYTQEDVLFEVHAIRSEIAEEQKGAAREAFFAKGQPCLRTSSLCKRYGWGIHHDTDGKVALYAVESEAYAAFSRDKKLKQLKAMRSNRA